MKRIPVFICFIVLVLRAQSQELYVFKNPASNWPAHAVSLKLTDHFLDYNSVFTGTSHRIMPQFGIGVSKKLMVQAGIGFSNMHTAAFKFESVNLYAKYRFLSKDGIHNHFRMAAFLELAHTKAPYHNNEIDLMGDRGGMQLGVIATQLRHRLALTGTLGITEVLDKDRTDKVFYIPARSYESVDYALSAGYLVLPREYISYKQVNLNVYLELMGQASTQTSFAYTDLAPAVQVILNSNTKLNAGYRFQVAGQSSRLSSDSWLFSVERTLLNAFPRKKKSVQ